jgi:hypothetical protein
MSTGRDEVAKGLRAASDVRSFELLAEMRAFVVEFVDL